MLTMLDESYFPGVAMRAATKKFIIDVFDDDLAIQVFSKYDKNSIMLEDMGSLEELRDLINNVIAQQAANGKGADHA
jgi:hypothetical protein